MSELATREWLVAFVAGVLDVAREEVDPTASWESLGVDSATTLVLVADLSAVLGREVRPIEVLENPTIDTLVEHLGTCEVPA
ncbi:acyl carrier protein [Actinophytocola oryzae]|uniref:Phosphopantetheine binding protein n=1 Tax=Actinophytocola oryzae TaxID=502181 RepID=A0A4V3FQU1_9PSEU|nr:acyl carrier protein [Actinophytocola oryzae]TDV41021.1 phosphopantetheine binding protein [Actinophytocola oryzae]